MEYEKELVKHLDEYRNLSKEYFDLTESEEYQKVCVMMPFEFLEAKQTVELLKLYNETEGKSPINFKNASEATVFYQGLISLRKDMDHILDSATYVVKASEIADKINDLVKKSPYLQKDLMIDQGGAVIEIAKGVLQELPKYPSLLTKNFKSSFVASCIQGLTSNGLDMLVQNGIIKKDDAILAVDKCSDVSKENISYLKETFGIEIKQTSENRVFRVAGTTYTNEDGKNRQDILKEMKDASGNEQLLFKNSKWEKDGILKDSTEITWKGKMLGYVPQSVVDDVNSKYDNPEFTSNSWKIVGGGDANFGCEVDATVTGQDKKKDEVVK